MAHYDFAEADVEQIVVELLFGLTGQVAMVNASA